jgi:hypothetical protein
MENSELIAFKAISGFVMDLGNDLEQNIRGLALYVRLIEKTTLVDEVPIKRHIKAFREFCIANREMILNKDIDLCVVKDISYSDRVFIDLKRVVGMVSDDCIDDVWTHLLTISAVVDPAGNAMRKLEEMKKRSGSVTVEEDFLASLMSTVEQNIDLDTRDPGQAVASLLSSGAFAKIVESMHSGVENGTIDMGKLLSTVTQLAGESGMPGMPGMPGMSGIPRRPPPN